MTSLKPSGGMSVLSAIVAVLILAAMGGAMAVIVSTNQESRSQQYVADQSFATAQAGLEVALGMIFNGVNPCESMNRNLSGDSVPTNNLTVNRTDGRIYVVGSKGDAISPVSIVDLTPPQQGMMLEIDTSNAKNEGNGLPSKRLVDIRFQLAPGCQSAVTITDLVISWDPDYGEKVDMINIDGNVVYGMAQDLGTVSGETTNITDQTIVGAGQHVIDFIQWDTRYLNRHHTIRFNFADGSSKTVTVDTL